MPPKDDPYLDPDNELYYLNPPKGHDGGKCIINTRVAIFYAGNINTKSLTVFVKVAIIWYWTDSRIAGWDVNKPLPGLLWYYNPLNSVDSF